MHGRALGSCVLRAFPSFGARAASAPQSRKKAAGANSSRRVGDLSIESSAVVLEVHLEVPVEREMLVPVFIFVQVVVVLVGSRSMSATSALLEVVITCALLLLLLLLLLLVLLSAGLGLLLRIRNLETTASRFRCRQTGDTFDQACQNTLLQVERFLQRHRDGAS